MDSAIFLKLPPTKLFFRCAIPSMISMVFGALYQIADGLFVGRFIGQDALASVNIVTPVLMMVFAFSNMIAVGASVRISVLLGENSREEASRVFSFTVKVIALLSILIGILGLMFARPLVRLLAPGATEQAIAYGVTYVRMYALFAPLVPIFFATDNFLRVCGRMKASMWLGVGSQVLNVVLDGLLIGIFRQGVWAAAFTSCLSMTLGSVVSPWLFRNKRLDLYYTSGRVPAVAFAPILANGSSEFFSNIAMSVMSLAYNFFLLRYGGTTGVAAFSVILYVDSIVGMLVFGMCDAMQPAISYCHGAGLPGKVKALFMRLLLGAAVLSVLALLFMRFAGRYVAPLFVKPEDTELLALSVAGMNIFLFLSDRVGGYVLFLLFYRTGAAGPISAYLVVWDAGVPHCVSGPPHAHMAAGRGLDDLHCLRYCKRDFYHRGCYDHEGPGNRCRLKNHVRSICASLPQPDFVFPGQTAILST